MPNKQPELAFAVLVEAFDKERAPGGQLVSDAELLAAAQYVAKEKNAADLLLSRLFPAGVTSGIAFYNGLYELQRRIGFSQHAALVAAEAAVNALQSFDEEGRQATLNSVVELDHRFFEALRLMPVIISKIPFPHEFVISWIQRVRQRLGNDMAQGDLWKTVSTWSAQHPEDALAGLRHLITSALDDDTISIAACILGNLRLVWVQASPGHAVRSLETELAASTDVQRRLVFHRSWINTGWQRQLTAEEFTACLDRMSTAMEEERSEGFNFLRCLLPCTNTTREMLLHGVTWLNANSNPSLPDELMGWAPPEDWHSRILVEPVLDGVCLPAHFSGGKAELAVPLVLKTFIDNSRREYPLKLPAMGGPASILVLACIKNVSPLPSEFWRASMFGPIQQ